MIPRSFFLQLIEKDLSEFEDFLHHSTDEEVRQVLEELHPADIADIIERIDEESRIRLMILLDTDSIAEILSLIEEHFQQEVLDCIPEEKRPEVIDKMPTDDATDILDDLSPEEAEEILEAMPPEESAEVRELLKYDEETAGGLMQTELVSVSPETTIAQAAQKLREESKRVSDIQNVYVVDDNEVLQGTLPIQSLILEEPEEKVSNVMDKDFFSVQPGLDQEKVAEMFQKYDLISLPVLDPNGALLGRILVDDIVDVIEEEASEDIYRLAGIDVEEHVTDSPFRSVRLRLPWLLLSLVTASIAASVVGFFQNTIQKAVILAVFMPIVAALGGNAGTQALVVITRGIAVGDVDFSNARKVLLREIATGILNGLLVGVIMAVVANYFAHSPMLGVVLGLALICNVFVASLAGAAIPLVLKWAKVDPALASGVFVTTFTDMAGFFTFLGLATLFLRYLT